MKVTVVSIVIGAPGTIPKWCVKGLKLLEIRGQVETLNCIWEWSFRIWGVWSTFWMPFLSVSLWPNAFIPVTLPSMRQADPFKNLFVFNRNTCYHLGKSFELRIIVTWSNYISSSCRVASTDHPDSFWPPVSIVRRLPGVLQCYILYQHRAVVYRF